MKDPQSAQPVTRRGFVTGTLAASVAAACTSARADTGQASRARNVILFSADGLSPSALGLADMAHRHETGEPLAWANWLQESPNVAWLRTEPADWLIADSTSSASAWSIGSRVNNNVVSILPTGEKPTPLLARLAQAGYMTGIMTSTSISDASPAAMVANAGARGDTQHILQQYASRGLCFAIGGGMGSWQRNTPQNSRDVTLIGDASRLREIDPDARGQFAILADGEIDCALDSQDPRTTSSGLVESVLEICQRSTRPFALFLESENTDTLGHYNDAAGLVREIFDIDRSLTRLREFVEQRDDTLLIVLTDHGNGSPCFVQKSHDARDHMDRLLSAKRSFRWIRSRFTDLPEQTPEAMASLVHEAQGVRFEGEEFEILSRWVNGDRVDPFAKRNRRYSPLASLLGNHFGTAFTADDHTSELIPAIALGPGADAIREARHHVDIHRVMTKALGLSPTT